MRRKQAIAAFLQDSGFICRQWGCKKEEVSFRWRIEPMKGTPLGAVVRHLRQFFDTEKLRDLTDGQLLLLFANENAESAFATLLQRYGPLVLGVCRRVLANQHDAEDAFQATFLVLLRRAGKLHGRGPLANW